MLKTYEGWNGSLNTYLQIGDTVDGEIVDHFLNVMPPVCFNSNLIQMGEPYNHVNGRPTYATLARLENGWTYCGHCFRGEIDEPTGNEYNPQLYNIKFIPETASLVLYNESEQMDYRFYSKYSYENGMLTPEDMEMQAHHLAAHNGVNLFKLDLSEF